MHQHSWFLTNTYSNTHLPDNYSLSKRHHQLFMKRLREFFPSNNIRYVVCGEYGSQSLRPHYHYVLFGINFGDLKVYRRTLRGHIIYSSQKLNDLWQLGECTLARFTPQTGSYVAGYITKSFKTSDTEAREAWSTRIHPLTGEQVRVIPEFLLASRRPGIGLPWFEKYGENLKYDDFIIVDGLKRPVPPYFLNKLPPEFLEVVKQRRKEIGKQLKHDQTEQRLMDKHDLAILDDSDKQRKGD